MGRPKRSDKELDKLDRIKAENKKLKRIIQSLRKQLKRNIIDQDTLDSLLEEEEIKEPPKPEKVWECWDCHRDYLRMITISRRDGVHYLRKCPNCGKRTRLQKLKGD